MWGNLSLGPYTQHKLWIYSSLETRQRSLVTFCTSTLQPPSLGFSCVMVYI